MCTRCWDAGTIIVPDAQLSNEQLNTMTQRQVWDFFEPYMKPMLPRCGDVFPRFSDVLDPVGVRDDSLDSIVTRSERLTVVVEENYEQP